MHVRLCSFHRVLYISYPKVRQGINDDFRHTRSVNRISRTKRFIVYFFLFILVFLDRSVNRAVKIIAVLIDELFLPW